MLFLQAKNSFPTCSQTVDSNRPPMHVFGLYKEAMEPRENPQRHREKMQTPQRKVPDLKLNNQC